MSMQKIKVELNSARVREMLRSDELKAHLVERAEQASRNLGEGYEVTGYTGRGRVNASILAVSDEALADQLENNTILKALKR